MQQRISLQITVSCGIPLFRRRAAVCEQGYLFVQRISRRQWKEKAREIKHNNASDSMKEFTMQPGDLTDDEREIILKGCLINYNRK